MDQRRLADKRGIGYKCGMRKSIKPWVGLVVFCAVVAVVIGAARGETIHLKDGKVLRGEVVAKKADKVFVDLGFTVLSVPADSIDRIVEDAVEDAGESTEGTAAGRLWHSDDKRPEMTVKQNVQRCGAGVVQVRTGAGLGSGFIIHPDGYVVTKGELQAGAWGLAAPLQTGDEAYASIGVIAMTELDTQSVAEAVLHAARLIESAAPR